MKPSSFYNRVVDVMEELARFTVMGMEDGADGAGVCMRGWGEAGWAWGQGVGGWGAEA